MDCTNFQGSCQRIFSQTGKYCVILTGSKWRWRWRGDPHRNARSKIRERTSAHLVGVLDEDVLALRLLHEEVRDGADDAPSVRQRDVQLVGEIGWADGLRAQDDMTGVVTWVGTRDVAAGHQLAGLFPR